MIKILIKVIEACGKHAKIVLPLGVIAAFFLPETDSLFKPAAPFILTFLVSVALIRLNIVFVIKEALQPRRLLQNSCLAILLLVGIPFFLFYISSLLGLNDQVQALIIWYSVSPPIGTTIWMCVFLGFSAPVAMEIVLLTNLLAPFTGPIMGELLLGKVMPLSVFDLSFKLSTILFGGIAIAIIIKHWLGEKRVYDYGRCFDGLATLLLLAFLVPVFDGVNAMVLASPLLSLGLAALALGLNFGHQASIYFGGWLLATLSQKKNLPKGTRSVAVVSGNRNLGLYFAALPPDPLFSLFVAAYQIPIYATPIVAGWFGKKVRNTICAGRIDLK